MRFGKRTRLWAAAGRRLLADRFVSQNMATSLIEEEHIPSMAGELENHTMMSAYDDEPVITGDPTQRLLTALGRFQRQVTRAENSTSQEEWCDACMSQVIAGLEIAIAEEWDNVREALIDTARILQTYEEYQRASEALPFLKDAYEILCLMVGDLLVDNVRSGVLNKWRDRYRQAVDEVEAAGMTLVEDESEGSSHEPNETSEPTSSAASTVSEPVIHDYRDQVDVYQDTNSTDAGYSEVYDEDHDVEEDQYGMASNNTPENDEASAAESPFEAPKVHDIYDTTWESKLDDIEKNFIDTDAPALDDVMMEASNPMINEIQSEARPESYVSDTEEDVPDKQFVEELFKEQSDDWDDALNELADSEMESITHARVDFVPEDLDIDDESLIEEDIEQPDQEPDAEAALRIEDTTGDVDTVGSMVHDDESSQPLHETLEVEDASVESVQEDETLSALVGEYTLQQSNIKEDSFEEHIEETSDESGEAGEVGAETATPLLDELAEAESASTTTAHPAPDSPEALWQTIQAAFSKGNVSDAKVTALQLAAQMAHLEVCKAQETVQKLEDQLALDVEAIDNAQMAFDKAKKDVQDCEWLLGEKNAALEKQHESLSQLQSEADQIQSGIDELERQITELQKRCEQEMERLDVVQEQISEVRKLESSIEDEVKTLHENGDNSKTALELAEERMKELEEERANHLLEMESARKLLREQVSSENDIRKTIEMFSGKIEVDIPADLSQED